MRVCQRPPEAASVSEESLNHLAVSPSMSPSGIEPGLSGILSKAFDHCRVRVRVSVGRESHHDLPRRAKI